MDPRNKISKSLHTRIEPDPPRTESHALTARPLPLLRNMTWEPPKEISEKNPQANRFCAETA